MDGYIGTLRTGCYLANFCISGAHDCNAGANCVYLGPALFRCEVSVKDTLKPIYKMFHFKMVSDIRWFKDGP